MRPRLYAHMLFASSWLVHRCLDCERQLLEDLPRLLGDGPPHSCVSQRRVPKSRHHVIPNHCHFKLWVLGMAEAATWLAAAFSSMTMGIGPLKLGGGNGSSGAFHNFWRHGHMLLRG